MDPLEGLALNFCLNSFILFLRSVPTNDGIILCDEVEISSTTSTGAEV
jgi:hypothetical protein